MQVKKFTDIYTHKIRKTETIIPLRKNKQLYRMYIYNHLINYPCINYDYILLHIESFFNKGLVGLNRDI